MPSLLAPLELKENVMELLDIYKSFKEINCDNINQMREYYVYKKRNSELYLWGNRRFKFSCVPGMIMHVKNYVPQPNFTVHSLRKMDRGIVCVISYMMVRVKSKRTIFINLCAVRCPYWNVKGLSKLPNNLKVREEKESGVTFGKDAEEWYAGVIGVSPGMRHDRQIKPLDGCRLGWDMEWLWLPGIVDSLQSKLFMACVSCLDCGFHISFNNMDSCQYDVKQLDSYNVINGKQSSFQHKCGFETKDQDLFCHIVNCVDELVLVKNLFRFLTLHFPAYSNAHNGISADNLQCMRVISSNIDRYDILNSPILFKNVNYKRWGNYTAGTWLDFPLSISVDSYIFSSRVLLFKKSSLAALAKRFAWSDKMDFKDFSIPRDTKAFADMMTYCAKDAFLHAKAIDGLNMPEIYTTMTGLTGCVKNDLICWNTGNIVQSMLAKMAYDAKKYVEWSASGSTKYPNIGGRSLYTEPGLFFRVTSMDLTSAYPTMISQAKLDPSTIFIGIIRDLMPIHERMHIRKTGNIVNCDLVRATVAWDDTVGGIFSDMVDALLTMRAKVKKDIKDMKQQISRSNEESVIQDLKIRILVMEGKSMCLKILANTVYGYQSSEYCNYGGKIMAELTTFLVSKCLECMKKAAMNIGWKTVGGDTDSIFMSVDQGSVTGQKGTKLIKDNVDTYLRYYEQHCVNSGIKSIELTIENYFPGIEVADRMIMVSKKHYAMCSGNQVIYKGLKPVRRDSTRAESILDKLYAEICLFIRPDKISHSLYYIYYNLCVSLRNRKTNTRQLMRNCVLKGKKSLYLKTVSGPVRIPITKGEKKDISGLQYNHLEYIKQFKDSYLKFAKAVDIKFVINTSQMEDLGRSREPVSTRELIKMTSYCDYINLIGFDPLYLGNTILE